MVRILEEVSFAQFGDKETKVPLEIVELFYRSILSVVEDWTAFVFQLFIILAEPSKDQVAMSWSISSFAFLGTPDR